MKYYWFSTKKHAVDIELVRNVLLSKFYDETISEKEMDLLNKLNNASCLGGANGKAVKVDAETYRLFDEVVSMAQSLRIHMNDRSCK